MIDDKEIEKLARLARIKISKEEAEKLSADIDSILSYVSEIKEAAFSAAQRDAGDEITNVMREDKEPHETGLYSDRLLKEAPQREGDYIKVKKIL
jgi:aspartyl-tRNA(Asn)/glutamyl-tRNA(Gln) amidotransferase subunit C